MKAMIIKSFGDADVFEPANIPEPTLKAGHLKIRVKAASVNPVDYKLRRGMAPDITPEFPAVLHGDFAGIVEDVGNGATRFQVGDEVFGCAGGLRGFSGALGEIMVVDERLAALKPKSLSFEEAAALPLVTLTAWEALFDKVTIKPTEKVLILGGTGGVGHIAVQLARLKTENVYSTASSTEKAKLLSELGAKQTFNHRSKTFIADALAVTSGKGFDIVFDTIGFESLDNAFQLAKLYGQVVTCQSSEGHDLSLVQSKSLSLHGVLMLLPMLTGMRREHHQAILDQLSKLAAERRVKAHIDRVFDLENVSEAHRYLESGKAVGKIIIRH